MDSALYLGWVRHDRRQPTRHRFTYRLGLVYLDLDELPQLEADLGLSADKIWPPISFKRSDYHGPLDVPLKQAIQDTVFHHLAMRLTGPIRLLTQPRMLGLCFNPVSFYYVFDASNRLGAIVAEITNTPWNERHCYVLPVDSNQTLQLVQFDKAFHVSPFMSMDQTYSWRFRIPDSKLMVHMENRQRDACIFSASLVLQRQTLNATTLRAFTRRHLFQGHQVLAAIYWQALKLKIKKTPFHDHPKHLQHNQSPLKTPEL